MSLLRLTVRVFEQPSPEPWNRTKQVQKIAGYGFTFSCEDGSRGEAAMKPLLSNREIGINYLRGVAKSIRRGRTSPKAWDGSVRWAMVLGVTAEEARMIADGRL